MGVQIAGFGLFRDVDEGCFYVVGDGSDERGSLGWGESGDVCEAEGAAPRGEGFLARHLWFWRSRLNADYCEL